MADTKISALSSASALAGTEVAPVVQSAATVKATIDQIGDRAQSRFGLTKNNATSSAPTVNSDSSAGYSVNSRWLDTSTGTEWFAEDVTVGAAVWIPSQFGGVSHFSYKSGYLYSLIHSTTNDVVVAKDLLYATCVTISKRVTIDALGVYVVTGDAAAGAKAVNLAIYDDSSGVPGNQVARLSAVKDVSVSATEATGALNGGNQTLNPGRYWLAALYSGTPTIRGISALDYVAASVKGGTLMVRQTSGSTNFVGFTGVATYPNFPNSNGAFGTATEVNANHPIAFFRIA